MIYSISNNAWAQKEYQNSSIEREKEHLKKFLSGYIDNRFIGRTLQISYSLMNVESIINNVR